MTATAESAYFRTLRDIESGHITLLVTVDRFDPMTGEELPEPVVQGVAYDRLPAAGTPDPTGAWWEPMVERGHLELTSLDRWGRVRYALSYAGRVFLSAQQRVEER